MKIAKKVLAVAMAVAMIACFAAMAFAAEDKVVLKAGEIVDGKFKVTLVANDYADLGDANWVVNYDAATLKCTAVGNGTNDLAQIATDTVALAVMGSKLITAYNNEVDGEVKIGFAFEGTLGADGEVVLCTFDFEVEDAEAANVEIKLTGANENTLNVVLKEVEEPTTEEPTTEEPTTEEAPSTPVELETKPGATDGDNKTGDTGVLAIAAGVVALAGAAFVVSKKRK